MHKTMLGPQERRQEGKSRPHDDELCSQQGVNNFDVGSRVKRPEAQLRVASNRLGVLTIPPLPFSPRPPPRKKNKHHKFYDAGPILFHLQSLVPLAWLREQCGRYLPNSCTNSVNLCRIFLASINARGQITRLHLPNSIVDQQIRGGCRFVVRNP